MTDFRRMSAAFQGMPENYLSYGTLGHTDYSPAFARVESDQVLVEVTLVPSGEEVVARVDVADGAWYGPIEYGQHVVVGFPGGSSAEPVVLGRVSDSAWPFPAEVCGVSTRAGLGAPQFAFFRTGAGQLIAIESGDGADVLVSSGGSIRLKAPVGEQILLDGRTHLGADFTEQPTGATVGPAGETVPGTSGVPHVPAPHVPLPGPPAPMPPFVGPGEGLVRVKDLVQSDITTDPVWWAFINGLWAIPAIGPVLQAAGIVLPTALSSHHKEGSHHTASDG